MSIPVMVGNAVDAISKNGVVMLNVALRGDGTLPENQAAYLTTFGEFIKINGEGIYGSRPWKIFGEGPLKMKDGRQGENHTEFSQEDIRFTSKDGVLYAFVLAPPTEDILIKSLKTGGLLNKKIMSVKLLGSEEEIKWERNENGLKIKLPGSLPDIPVIGFRIDADYKHYPEFSWDHVPLYQHMRKSIAFNQEELEYLAKFPIITLEKTTGSASYGSSEKGSIEAAKAIKQINPNAKVLYYRNIMVHYNTYDINSEMDQLEQPYLVNSQGNAKIVHGGKREAYDLTNPELRKWWLDHCVEMAEIEAIDGIFIDGNIKALEHEFLGNVVGDEKKNQVKEDYDQMMADLRKAVPKDKLLIANLIRARLKNSGLSYMEHFDGSYLEAFEGAVKGYSKAQYVEKAIVATQEAARNGKIICMSMGMGRERRTGLGIDDTRMKMNPLAPYQDILQYKLAIFLVCAEKYSYFLAHDGYSVNGDDSYVWLKTFPEYKKPLGPPKGPAKKDGYVYTREFEHASVWLDIKNEEAKITWEE